MVPRLPRRGRIECIKRYMYQQKISHHQQKLTEMDLKFVHIAQSWDTVGTVNGEQSVVDNGAMGVVSPKHPPW